MPYYAVLRNYDRPAETERNNHPTNKPSGQLTNMRVNREITDRPICTAKNCFEVLTTLYFRFQPDYEKDIPSLGKQAIDNRMIINDRY